MKLIVNDNEIAFLYKNGVFTRLLTPGKHRFREFLGERAIVKLAVGAVDGKDINLPALRKDAEFAKLTATAEVPDGSLAVRFEDGNIVGILKPGIHTYWNISVKNTFELLDTQDPNAANKVPALYMKKMPPDVHTAVSVSDGEVGVLFFDGAYQRTLTSGQYYFWNNTVKVAVQAVDTRLQQLDIAGQEILTADKVSLRVNFVCSFRVTDPVSIVTKLKDYKTQLHVLAQLALRELAGKYRFDELLKQKDAIGGLVLEKLKERETEFFVEFADAGVKDIILPGEIRDIMNTVLVAEKTAQAGVITRREETAATKSLLDTAKLMDENVTLFKLKEMEYLERICDKVGSISVGSGGVLDNLRGLLNGEK